MKHVLAVLVAFVLLVPSADAAVIATTKQKTLPVIGDAYVAPDGKAFGFAVKKATTTQAYDVWVRIVGGRGKVAGEWFVRSTKLRTRTAKPGKMEFAGDVAGYLTYEKAGSYTFTLQSGE